MGIKRVVWRPGKGRPAAGSVRSGPSSDLEVSLPGPKSGLCHLAVVCV